jgi:hypothetical protein
VLARNFGREEGGMAGREYRDAGPQPEEVAAYVATMALELKTLVEPHDQRSLAYLLDLMRSEAEELAEGKPNRIAAPNPSAFRRRRRRFR